MEQLANNAPGDRDRLVGSVSQGFGYRRAAKILAMHDGVQGKVQQILESFARLHAQDRDDVRVLPGQQVHEGRYIVMADRGGDDQGQRGAQTADGNARRGSDRCLWCGWAGFLLGPSDQDAGGRVGIDQKGCGRPGGSSLVGRTARTLCCGPRGRSRKHCA
jgi:hypothetical protein